MLDCSPFSIVSPYWFLQLNIEWSCSPVWDESTPASTGVWNQVNHRLLSLRQHYPDCQIWEGEERIEGWRTGMSHQRQVAEWIVLTSLSEEMSLLWLFSTKIPKACQATHTFTHKSLLYIHQKFSSHYHSRLCPSLSSVLRLHRSWGFIQQYIFIYSIPRDLANITGSCIIHGQCKTSLIASVITHLDCRSSSFWFQCTHCHHMA